MEIQVMEIQEEDKDETKEVDQEKAKDESCLLALDSKKPTSIISQKETFCRQIISEINCMRKETVDISYNI